MCNLYRGAPVFSFCLLAALRSAINHFSRGSLNFPGLICPSQLPQGPPAQCRGAHLEIKGQRRGHGARRGCMSDLLIKHNRALWVRESFSDLFKGGTRICRSSLEITAATSRPHLDGLMGTVVCLRVTDLPFSFFLTAISHWGPEEGCWRSQLIKCKLFGVWCLAQGCLPVLTRTPPKCGVKIRERSDVVLFPFLNPSRQISKSVLSMSKKFIMTREFLQPSSLMLTSC